MVRQRVARARPHLDASVEPPGRTLDARIAPAVAAADVVQVDTTEVHRHALPLPRTRRLRAVHLEPAHARRRPARQDAHGVAGRDISRYRRAGDDDAVAAHHEGAVDGEAEVSLA